MKKLLLLLISIAILLSGCSKSLTWQDVEQTYKQVENEVSASTSDITTVDKQDYEELLNELDSYVETIEFDQKQENQEKLENIYKLAQYINVLASLSNGNCAQELLSLSNNSKQLVKAIYSGDKDAFNNLKNDVKTQINDISNWADDNWKTVEKKALILWDSISSQIEQLEEKTQDSITNFNEISEVELEQLKHTIIDNYEVIKDGVTEDTNAIAQKMYEAAVKLAEYTRLIYSDEADKVYYFAKDAQSYIKECYGKVLDEEEAFKQNFEDDVAAAKKWTQSTWNQITKELKLYEKNKQ